jgi:ribosomal subunit interface protein
MNNVKFYFKGVKIDNRTRDYIEKRLSALNKLAGKIFNIEVEIEMEKKGKFRVEIMVKTPFNLYRSEETTESIEGSVDIVVSELKVQIKKDKDRRNTLIKRGGLSIKKRVSIDQNARF